MSKKSWEERRREILRQVSEGIISPQDASSMLAAEEGGIPQPLPPETPEDIQVLDIKTGEDLPPVPPHGSGCARAVWSLVLLSGVALTALSSYWMYSAWQNHGFGWGFWFALLALLISIGIIVTGAQLQSAPWLHLRIKQKPGEKPERIELHFPLPVDMVIGVLSFAEPFLPAKVREKRIKEMLMDMRGAFRPGEPMQVQVDDEDGEQVEIFIG